MTLRTLAYNDIMNFGPCYDPALPPRNYITRSWQGTALDVLNLNAEAMDRLWVICQTNLFDRVIYWQTLVFIAERARDHALEHEQPVDPGALAALEYCQYRITARLPDLPMDGVQLRMFRIVQAPGGATLFNVLAHIACCDRYRGHYALIVAAEEFANHSPAGYDHEISAIVSYLIAQLETRYA
jgi:hypothetical protein